MRHGMWKHLPPRSHHLLSSMLPLSHYIWVLRELSWQTQANILNNRLGRTRYVRQSSSYITPNSSGIRTTVLSSKDAIISLGLRLWILIHTFPTKPCQTALELTGETIRNICYSIKRSNVGEKVYQSEPVLPSNSQLCV